MKILVTIPFFYPHTGGAQKYAEELYAELKVQHPEIQVDILCYNTDNAPKHEIYRGMNIFRVPCYTFISGKFILPRILPLLLLLRELSRNKYNYVNSHTAFFDTTWWAWYFAKRNGAKSIFTGHAPGNPTHQHKSVEWVGKFIHNTLGKWSIRKYDIYTYANNKSKEFFENIMGVRNGGTVIHIAIDDKKFNPKEKTSELSIPNVPYFKTKDEIVITFIGRMIETKGVNYFYEAIKILRSNIHETLWNRLKFVFAGPGPLNKTIKELSELEGLKNKIHFAKNIDSDQVAQLLKMTDIFVSPSSHAEGLPTTILEAGASGCLVIATNSGSISDVVLDKKTGILIPMKSVTSIEKALNWALNNKDLSDSISQSMTNLILQNFTWDVIAKKYWNLLIKKNQQ